jgi:hypothetical protein
MKKRRLNLRILEHFSTFDEVLFVKPYGSKVFRVPPISEAHKLTGKYNDIIDILNAVSIKRINGIWYVADKELLDDALLLMFDKMNIDTFKIEAEEPPFGIDNDGKPIQTILN